MANMTTLQILQGIKTWVTTKLNLKQDVINDLANIRSGAQAGSTAVQPAELSAYFNDASYDNNTHRINFYHGQTVVAYVDASPFIIDGMVDDVRIENGYLVIDFNTASGKQDISIPLTDIFNPNNYYNKTQTDGLLSQKQDVIQDLADIRSGASAGSTAVQPSDMESAIGEAKQEIVEDVEENYAKKDGAYETLLAGSALNLQGQQVSQNNSMYRTTAGSNDVASGIAELVSVKGNTVKWNEKRLNHGNYTGYVNNVTLKYNADSKLFIVRGTATDVGLKIFSGNYPIPLNAFKKNHKYYVGGTSNVTLQFYRGSGSYWPGPGLGTNHKGIYNYGYETPTNNYGVAIRVENGKTYDEKFYFHVIDVTEIYGKGNEPSRVAEFEADYQRWFGKPLTYEPYDAGSLHPVLINSIKTVGFNQYNPSNGLVKAIVGSQYQITGTYNSIWESDEEEVSFVSYTYGDTTEIGLRYSNGNGRYMCNSNIAAYSNASTYGVGNFVIYDGSIYKCSTAISTAEEWDATKWDLIADVAAMVTEGIFSAMNITPDSNGLFIPAKFYVHVEGGSTDTCVHLTWSGTRNGEYEPYKVHVVQFDVTQLRGKLNGEGDSVVVFPDGMKSARNVYDEIKVADGIVKAIKRVNSVDLGNRNWTYSSIFSFSSYKLNASKRQGSSGIPNFLCVKYDAISWGNIYGKAEVGIGLYPTDSFLCVYDNSYTQDAAGAAKFKTDMQGVYLYYELAQPQEYVLDDIALPLNLTVDDWGTEEVVGANGGCAPTLGIIYGINAVDQLRRMPQSYISEASMDNFLSRLGSVMGGTWSKTWNAESEQYDFSFTQSVQSTTNEGE